MPFFAELPCILNLSQTGKKSWFFRAIMVIWTCPGMNLKIAKNRTLSVNPNPSILDLNDLTLKSLGLLLWLTCCRDAFEFRQQITVTQLSLTDRIRGRISQRNNMNMSWCGHEGPIHTGIKHRSNPILLTWTCKYIYQAISANNNSNVFRVLSVGYKWSLDSTSTVSKICLRAAVHGPMYRSRSLPFIHVHYS